MAAQDTPTAIVPAANLPYRVVPLCFLVALADGYDAQSIGYVGPAVMEAFAVGPVALGTSFSAGLAGLMLGAFGLSVAADRIGRKAVILLSCLLMGMFSLLTAMSSSFEMFVAARFFTGIGLGGAMPAINALTADHAPVRYRATFLTAMFMGVPIGAILGGIVARGLLAHAGWQGVFWIGGVLPLLLIPLLALGLPPESQRSRTTPPRPAMLVAQPLRQASLLLWALFFVNLLLVYSLINWLPPLLEARGMPRIDAMTAPLWFNIGGLAGGLVLAPIADRIGPGRLCALTLVGGAAAIAVTALVGLPMALAGAALIGGFIGGTQFLINATAMNIYPPELRASGIGSAMTIGRIGAILGPLLLGALMAFGVAPDVVMLALALIALPGALAAMRLSRR